MGRPNSIASESLLTTEQAADYLHVSISYLAKARMRGTGPAFIQLGRAIRYSLPALDAFRAAQTRTTTSQQQTVRLTPSRKSHHH